MSLEDYFGHWGNLALEEGDPKRYGPETHLLIGRHKDGACSVAWLDEDGNLCLLSNVPYVEKPGHVSRLHGTCRGRCGTGQEIDYVVDISFHGDSWGIAIQGKIALPTDNPPGGPPDDDPLTGLWTADRRPPGGGGLPPDERGGARNRADRPAK